MAGRIRWIERKFSFDFPTDFYPEIMERLRGTPARVEHRVRNVRAKLLTDKQGDSWSIQEHVGHLVSVEFLLTCRLDDYDHERKELQPADMKNRRTEEAGYNDKDLDSILIELGRVRNESVARLESKGPDYFSRTSFHPRLKVPMRVVDSMYFFAEHDDYHLARITDLIRRE